MHANTQVTEECTRTVGLVPYVGQRQHQALVLCTRTLVHVQANTQLTEECTRAWECAVTATPGGRARAAATAAAAGMPCLGWVRARASAQVNAQKLSMHTHTLLTLRHKALFCV